MKWIVRGWAVFVALLGSSIGAPPEREAGVNLGTAAAWLEPSPYTGERAPRLPPPAASVASAGYGSQRAAARSSARSVLAPSPYELPLSELAPNPYDGSVARLAPAPYDGGRAVASQRSVSLAHAGGAIRRSALAPSPYGLVSAPDLAPSPY